MRTLDQVGEETNAERYRDLVHEIDRAFAGYERIAARHGWMADRGLNADAALAARADAGLQQGDASLGHADLLEFVMDALGADATGAAADPGGLGGGFAGTAGVRRGDLHVPADAAA